LVLAPASVQLGEVVGDLLQAQHVEVGNSACIPHDAFEIEPPIHAEAPLNIPGNQPHVPLPNAGAHEALHKLPLEEEETKE
jgi:hypothetical protein